MNVTKLIADVLAQKELVDLIEYYGKKCGSYNFTIDEEWNPILNMISSNPTNITLITRLMYFFEKLSTLEDSLEINYYLDIFKNLQKMQVKNCRKEDKWYFINLGLL